MAVKIHQQSSKWPQQITHGHVTMSRRSKWLLSWDSLLYNGATGDSSAIPNIYDL